MRNSLVALPWGEGLKETVADERESQMLSEGDRKKKEDSDAPFPLGATFQRTIISRDWALTHKLQRDVLKPCMNLAVNVDFQRS